VCGTNALASIQQGQQGSGQANVQPDMHGGTEACGDLRGWRFNRPRPASEGGKRMQFAELQLAELQAGGWRVGEGGSSRGRIRDWIGESVIRIHGTGPWHGMVRGVQDSLRSWNKHLVEAVD